MHTKGSRQWRSCQVAIEQKPTSMDRTAIEHLSSIQKVSRWIENLLRSYLDKVQKAWWIEIVLIAINKRSLRGSIERNLSRICWEAIELEKKRVFQREEKHKEMNTTKQATQHKSKQDVKLLKTSPNKNSAKHS